MNGKTAKRLRKKAGQSNNPPRAYRVLKSMIVNDNISIEDIENLDISIKI